MKFDLSLYGIIDPQIARGRSLAEMARTAALAGMTLLQYRAKDLDTRSMVSEARAIKAALAGTGVPLLINDRVDVAMAAGADGVHIGRDDMTPADARALLGPDAIIGSTVKSADDVHDLVGAPIDYICIGGVFGTRHKDNPDPPIGVKVFQDFAVFAGVLLGPMPIGAIAGINADNVEIVIASGADGVAVIGALFAEDDVAASTRTMVHAIKQARQGQA